MSANIELIGDREFKIQRLIDSILNEWGVIKSIKIIDHHLCISLKLYHVSEIDGAILHELTFGISPTQYLENNGQFDYVGIVATVREIATQLEDMPIQRVTDEQEKQRLSRLALKRRIEAVFIQDDSDWSSPIVNSILWGV